MGSFEQEYGDDSLSTFTGKERTQLRKLHRQLDDKFDEIAALLARELGCNEADAREEAVQALERWEEDIKIGTQIEPTTPLQRLLYDYCEMSEAIQDIRDEALFRARENPR